MRYTVIGGKLIDSNKLYNYVKTLKLIEHAEGDKEIIQREETKRRLLHNELLEMAKVERNDFSDFNRDLQLFADEYLGKSYRKRNQLSVCVLTDILDTPYLELAGREYPKCPNCGNYEYHVPLINICNYCGTKIHRLNLTMREIIISDGIFGSGGLNTLWSILFSYEQKRMFEDKLSTKAIAIYEIAKNLKCETACAFCKTKMLSYKEVREHYAENKKCRGKYYNFKDA